MSFSVLGADLHVPVGGKIRVECTYINNTGSIVEFGDSFDSETCFTGIYHCADDAQAGDVYACSFGQTPDIVKSSDIVRD